LLCHHSYGRLKSYEHSGKGTLRSLSRTDFGGRPEVFLEKSENNQVSEKISQDYMKWKEQDQVVYKWHLVSISPMLRIEREACTHSFEVLNETDIYFSTEVSLRTQFMNFLVYEHIFQSKRLLAC